jgi:hypothetical protein
VPHNVLEGRAIKGMVGVVYHHKIPETSHKRHSRKGGSAHDIPEGGYKRRSTNGGSTITYLRKAIKGIAAPAGPP